MCVCEERGRERQTKRECMCLCSMFIATCGDQRTADPLELELCAVQTFPA